jgi:predicted enzyme related to lactoylglutathione lyase
MADSFFWYELLTNDVDAAAEFYRAVIDWRPSAFAGGEGYTVLNIGDRGIGGIMALSAAQCADGARPGWLGYIPVDDIDAAVAGLTAAGATLQGPPWHVPGAGRIAALSDPQGAAFMLMAPQGEDMLPLSPQAAGAIGWCELWAADGDAAFAFYADQFGWRQVGSYDMGPAGLYRLFAGAGSGDVAIGGMMTRMDQAMPPRWNFYFNVDGLEAAVARVGAAGGAIRMAPHQVPGGSWIAHCVDPHGAAFVLLSTTP